MSMRMQVLFGELRAHLATTPGHDGWGERLQEIAREARAESAIEYEQAWVPYLERASPTWPVPLMSFSALEPFEDAVQMLGFCSMFEVKLNAAVHSELKLYSRGNWVKIAREFLARERVSHLELAMMTTRIDELRAFVELPGVSSLMRLALFQNGVTDEGVKLLAESPYLHGLSELYIVGGKISDDGVIALSTSPLARNLRLLDLSENRIGDAGARALAHTPALAGLEELVLHINELTDQAALALVDSEHLHGLTKLDLWGNHFTEPAKRTLRERFGERLRL